MRRFITFLVRHIPRPWLIRLSYPFRKIVVSFYKGNNHECTVCGGTFRKLLPYGNSGMDNRMCPKCLALERHRLMWSHFKNNTTLFTEPHKVLHVAPEQPFMERFRKMDNLDYTTGDLVSPLADVKMDIMNIPFEKDTFDVVICNHVLEHVQSDIKAMEEVLRILKPGGWAILQVPINYNYTETHEDLTITDPKERERVFGQYDHVRWHGLDYGKRLTSAGFDVDENRYIDSFSDEEIERYRFIKGEVLYIAKKPLV